MAEGKASGWWVSGLPFAPSRAYWEPREPPEAQGVSDAPHDAPVAFSRRAPDTFRLTSANLSVSALDDCYG